MGRAAAVAALALALACGGCGDADDPAVQPAAAPDGAVELTVLYDDGSGRKTTGTLSCRGADRRAAGALDGTTPPAKLCAQASGIADLLTSKPDKGRTCTQIYGGPETARVTGTIEGKKVDRRFTRTNGCELADYTRAAGLLQQP
jgi:outer membrane lipoprotein SlyB